jgi:hypothetical protein
MNFRIFPFPLFPTLLFNNPPSKLHQTDWADKKTAQHSTERGEGRIGEAGTISAFRRRFFHD